MEAGQHSINVNDNLTWDARDHTVKTGLFYQRSRKDQPAWGNINGEISFGLDPTSVALVPAGRIQPAEIRLLAH